MWIIYRVTNGNILQASTEPLTVTKPGFALAEVANPHTGLVPAREVVGWRFYPQDGYIAKLSAKDLEAQLKGNAAFAAKQKQKNPGSKPKATFGVTITETNKSHV